MAEVTLEDVTKIYGEDVVAVRDMSLAEKAQGAKSARVIVELVTNPKWQAYLESQ